MRARHAGGLIALALAGVAAWPGAAHAAPVEAGAGRADITPPNGYVLGGWTRADRRGTGAQGRLQASAIVLRAGDRRVALVSVDLFAAPGGLVKDAAARAPRGYSERNVLVSASHTHSGPGGFANFDTFNTVAPSVETIGDPTTFVELLAPAPADPRLYGFLVDRIAAAIRRADRDLAPAAVGWGRERLTSVTRNRSLEAHLADHGRTLEPGAGRPADDPKGPAHTIDPGVDVLRVDHVRGGRRVPIGAWSNFANHGTVNPSDFQVYTQDHHGPASRTLEAAIRKQAGLPAGARVVNVYGNGNEGDQSAGLDGQGPAIADRVGTSEGRAMFRAWAEAGGALSRRPELDLRWTRVCFCGQPVVGGGRVADSPLPGLPFLTGSEEGRGPLFDLTGIPFEGRRGPAGFESQGHKIGIPASSPESVPIAAPLLIVRVADRIVASLPGEPTVEVGRRVRGAALDQAADAGVERVIVAGLANEFLLYITTPEEYDRQHYEGGSTLFGPYEGHFLRDQSARLARRLATGRSAPKPYRFDPRNGVKPLRGGFGPGAEGGVVTAQPRASVTRCGFAELGWSGGPRGLDRPLDDPFVTVERRDGKGWSPVSTDLDGQIVWTAKDAGAYLARWEVPAQARPGPYRLLVSANRYQLASSRFEVVAERRRVPMTPVGNGYIPAALSRACTR